MTFNDIIAVAKAERCVGLRYQQTGRHPYRDRITVYRDGVLLFERFCYGEAAGKVFSMRGHADGAQAVWNYEACANSKRNEAPCHLTGGDETALQLDDKADAWECVDKLKTDRENGYGLLRLFSK